MMSKAMIAPALRGFRRDWEPLSDAMVRELARFTADDGDPMNLTLMAMELLARRQDDKEATDDSAL